MYFHQFRFFFCVKKIAKKGNCGLISILHSMKVKCDLSCQKNKPDQLCRKKKNFLMQEVMLHFLVDASHWRAKINEGEV